MKRPGLNDDERKLDVCKALLGEPADAVVGELLSTISILRLEVAGHLDGVEAAREEGLKEERARWVKAAAEICTCGGSKPAGDCCDACEVVYESASLERTETWASRRQDQEVGSE